MEISPSHVLVMDFRKNFYLVDIQKQLSAPLAPNTNGSLALDKHLVLESQEYHHWDTVCAGYGTMFGKSTSERIACADVVRFEVRNIDGTYRV
jgi:hypothetical protein